MILEFGVYQGQSLIEISKFFSPFKIKCFGFDTFTGLTQDWRYSPELTIPKNAYTTDGITPSGLPNNAELVIGDATEKIVEFLNKNTGAIRFAHFDMDIYQPTKKVLEIIKNRLDSASILCFDEHHGYPGWRENEFKALQEVFHISQYTYLGFSEMSAAIQLKISPSC